MHIRQVSWWNFLSLLFQSPPLNYRLELFRGRNNCFQGALGGNVGWLSTLVGLLCRGKALFWEYSDFRMEKSIYLNIGNLLGIWSTSRISNLFHNLFFLKSFAVCMLLILCRIWVFSLTPRSLSFLGMFLHVLFWSPKDLLERFWSGSC